MMEMQFILSMIFRSFDIEITSELDPDLSSMITLRPTEDIMARIKPRFRH